MITVPEVGVLCQIVYSFFVIVSESTLIKVNVLMKLLLHVGDVFKPNAAKICKQSFTLYFNIIN